VPEAAGSGVFLFALARVVRTEIIWPFRCREER
jgi:hypothetical protein